MGLESFKNASTSEELESVRKIEQQKIAERESLDPSDLAELTIEDDVRNGSIYGCVIKGTIKGVGLTMHYAYGEGGERTAHIEGKNPTTGVEINQDLPRSTTDRLFGKLYGALRDRDQLDKDASFQAQEMHEKETLADIFGGTAAENLFVSADK